MEKFDFVRHWYPVRLLADLDSNQPQEVTILGKSLVVWKPLQQKNYVVFLNQCPHRLAPLSEGRIDEKSDRLMCSYHGWEFDAQGHCANIPQAERAELTSKQASHLCAKALPTQEQQDLLWVWLDPGTSDMAPHQPLPLSEMLKRQHEFVWTSYARELDYDWQTLVENLVDPSHVNFAHHSLQGDRHSAKPLPFKIKESSINRLVGSMFPGAEIEFRPPCFLNYMIPLGDDKKVGLVIYCVPVMPGKSRLITLFPRNFAKQLGSIIPRWWEHIALRHRVLDSDMIILQHQEYFAQQHPEDWKKAYTMPTSADRFVIEFRRWFDQYCGGILPWDALGIQVEPATMHDDRRQVLDRYQQHTLHCRSCRRALSRIQWLKRFLGGLIFILLLTIAYLADSLPAGWHLAFLALSLICGAIAAILHYKLEPMFFFVDFRHQDNR